MTAYVTIVVYVPVEYTEAVRVAMCAAGAGTVDDGRYDRVTYISRCVCKYRVLKKTSLRSQPPSRGRFAVTQRNRRPGDGEYRVLDKARGKAGATGEEYETEENRIEAICHRERIEATVKAIVGAHPYETPAIAIYPTLTGEYKYWQG